MEKPIEYLVLPVFTKKKFSEYPTAHESYPLFHGDIFGDWREEFIMTDKNYSMLIIFTTNVDTSYRITALSQDPGMRNSMSLNGYKQSHMSLMYMATDMDIKKERNYLKKYLAERALKSYPINNDGDNLTDITHDEEYATENESNGGGDDESISEIKSNTKNEDYETEIKQTISIEPSNDNKINGTEIDNVNNSKKS